MKRIFLLQGFFLQKDEYLDRVNLTRNPGHEIMRAMLRNGFQGFINSHPSEPEKLVGSMSDRCGKSELTHVVMAADRFRFRKKYSHRTDIILYEFIPSGMGSWIGQYQGEAVGIGLSRCVLVEVPDFFFDANSILPPHFQPKDHLSTMSDVGEE